jgi:hypothetical protein
MQERNETQRPILVKITFGCQDVFAKSILGTGNWTSAFYALRLAALLLGDVNVQMTCRDAVKKQTKSHSLPGSWKAFQSVEKRPVSGRIKARAQSVI